MQVVACASYDYSIMILVAFFKADVHFLKKLKQECEEHKVCTNLGVAVSYGL